VSEAVKTKQVLPLADVTGVWSSDFSEYPDRIRVAMSDGKVIDYRLDIDQPHPAFRNVMGLLEKIPYGISKAGYRARHTKK
jgi:hypothetical protein